MSSLAYRLSQLGQAPVDEGLHRALAAAQDGRDLVAGQVGVEPEDQGSPLALGKGGEGVEQLMGTELRPPAGRRPEMVPLPALAAHERTAAVDHRPVKVARRVVDALEPGLEAQKAVLDDLLCQVLGAEEQGAEADHGRVPLPVELAEILRLSLHGSNLHT